MLHKKGMGPIGAILIYLVFILNWFIWLGAWVGQVGLDAVTTNNMTGVEAFFFSNLNFAVFIGVLLGTMGFMYFGGSQY